MAAFKKAFSNRPFTGTILFLVFLYSFEEWLFGFPQVRFFQVVITFRPQKELLIAIASSIASYAICYLIIWCALVSSRLFQAFYVFLFSLSTLVQYGFWKAVERFLSSADMHIASATPLTTWEGASAIYFDWRFILPVFGFVAMLIVFSQRQSLKSSFIKVGCISFLIVSFNFLYTFTDKSLNLGLSLSSFYQTIARYTIDNMVPAARETINYHSSQMPQNNIVLVIDESIRGDHLSINGYSRETTPFLSSLARTDSGFHNFGIAVAGATCSYPSNALILTGVRPGIDDFKMVESYPTIFQYAKAMGYKTYYFDAQTSSLWNGLTDHDLAYVDSWYKAADLNNDLDSDLRAADRIAKIVSKGVGNFIVLNKRGIHFLYESSYPAEAAKWLPLPNDYPNQPDLVSNSYDNGIFYNINSFFGHLLANPQILEYTTILYTSDHGQTLFENQASWLHCNSTRQEATVPLILFGRNLPVVDTAYHPRHSNILPTILDLMNVPMDQRTHTYSLSLFSESKETATDYFFFDGALRLIDFFGD